MGVPNPRAAFQDKGVGVGRGWVGGGAGKRAIRAAARTGRSQPGHGGCTGGTATSSRRQPRAPRSPGLLGLRCAGNCSEPNGGCLQSSPAGAGAGDHLATRCHHARLWLPLPLPVPALSGTPLHRAPAGPGLHRPAGHRIPAPRTAARACPGQLPPPLSTPPPGRLSRAVQPGPLSAPADRAAAANPGLTRVPSRSHARKGLGLRRLESRTLGLSSLPVGPRTRSRDLLPYPHPYLSRVLASIWGSAAFVDPSAGENSHAPEKLLSSDYPHLNREHLGWTLHTLLPTPLT